MKEQFEQFCEEKMYLKSVAKETLNFYLDSFRARERIMGDAPFTKQSLKIFGISPGELYLQRCPGHSTLTMTRRYAQISDRDLSVMHKKTSILSRLK